MADTTKSRRRGRPRTFDRDRALGVALDSYWRDGPQAVSLNEVCRRAGISKPGLYREFGSEDGLIDAVLSHYSEHVLAPTLQSVDPEQPFHEQLDKLVALITSERGSSPVGCLLARLRSAAGSLGPRTRARIQALCKATLAAHVAWVTQAQSRGEVSRHLDPELAARFLDAQLGHILGQMTAGDDPALVRAQAHLAFAGLTRPGRSGTST